MPLTRKFVDTVQFRANHDPDFRGALFEESLQSIFEGDVDGAREMLRICINATVGFQTISERSGLPIKSLMRMLGPKGNPRLINFAHLLQAIQEETGMHATVQVLNDEADISFQVVASSSSATQQIQTECQMVEELA